MKRLALVAILASFCAARAEAAIISALSPTEGQGLPGASFRGGTFLGQDHVYWSTAFSGRVDVGTSNSLAAMFGELARGEIWTLTSPGLKPLAAGGETDRDAVLSRDVSGLTAASGVVTSLESFVVSFIDDGVRIQFSPVSATDLNGQLDEPGETLVNPEPSSIVLFTLGGVGMLLGARRRVRTAVWL